MRLGDKFDYLEGHSENHEAREVSFTGLMNALHPLHSAANVFTNQIEQISSSNCKAKSLL